MKACALLAMHNEEDIILESVEKLISQGIEVYILDNNSSDNSVSRINHLVGRGVINIENIVYEEDGKEVYSWISILKKKEELSKNLNYDWYLHVDADEVRYGPWDGLPLIEAIDRVDREGFNLINFKLFNFRLYEDQQINKSFENSFEYYSPIEHFNKLQVKCWKKCQSINLHTHGGHLAQIDNPRLYPVEFILKHYPLRSIEQARRKIIKDRYERFSYKEREMGWHIQYDHLNLKDLIDSEFLYQKNQLINFDIANERYSLILESKNLLISHVYENLVYDHHYNKLSLLNKIKINLSQNFLTSRWKMIFSAEGLEKLQIDEILDTVLQIKSNILTAAQQNKKVLINSEIKSQVLRVLRYIALNEYLSGNPQLRNAIYTLE